MYIKKILKVTDRNLKYANTLRTDTMYNSLVAYLESNPTVPLPGGASPLHADLPEAPALPATGRSSPPHGDVPVDLPAPAAVPSGGAAKRTIPHDGQTSAPKRPCKEKQPVLAKTTELRQGTSLAVAQEDGWYAGQVTKVLSDTDVEMRFLNVRPDGLYCWPEFPRVWQVSVESVIRWDFALEPVISRRNDSRLWRIPESKSITKMYKKHMKKN